MNTDAVAIGFIVVGFALIVKGMLRNRNTVAISQADTIFLLETGACTLILGSVISQSFLLLRRFLIAPFAIGYFEGSAPSVALALVVGVVCLIIARYLESRKYKHSQPDCFYGLYTLAPSSSYLRWSSRSSFRSFFRMGASFDSPDSTSVRNRDDDLSRTGNSMRIWLFARLKLEIVWPLLGTYTDRLFPCGLWINSATIMLGTHVSIQQLPGFGLGWM